MTDTFHTSSKVRPKPDNRRRIFFLSRNPDQKTYGPYFFSQGLLIIDGKAVLTSDGLRKELILKGASKKPSQFMKKIQQELERQNQTEKSEL
ncbi:MAG: hypothetical protein ACFCU8_04480 [Thermosynechococcaceae cyanobacterium]